MNFEAVPPSLARLDALLDPPADALLEAYFDLARPFAADTFDTLGLNDPAVINTDDLLACTFLDVTFRPPAVRSILGADRDRLSELLTAIPLRTSLWDALDSDLLAAEAAWNFLRGYDGVDWVMAGKMLARKRPGLVPILDSVVTAALQLPSGTYWTTLRTCLQDDALRQKIERLRPPGLTARVTTLRLLDVAIWMRGSESVNARSVRQSLGMAVSPR
jgi:hypothetical protein